MSQHDMDVANGPGLTVRTDINDALQALASNSVGALAPTTTFPCQWWADTTAGLLKRRNSANSAWIDMGPLDSLSYLLISGGTMTGTINDAATQTIASATTTDIGAATSNVVIISGTTTITGLGTIAAGARRSVRFSGILTLTHNVTSLILPGNSSIITAAGDCAEFRSLGSGNWVCTSFTPASGSYYRTNILGTVSQAGGVPTGAIIENVTNANGRAIKYADGTMICLSPSLSSTGTTTAVGSIFYSNPAIGWTFPVAFVGAIPAVSAGNATNVQFITNIFCSSLTTASVACVHGQSIAGSISIYAKAVGRWF